MPNEFNIKNGFISQGNSIVNGSLTATTYYGDGSNLTGVPNFYVTGGTYSNGTLTLNRQNGSVTITGFTTGFTSVDTYVTGFTYNNSNLLTVSQNGKPDLNVYLNQFSGLTVNGNLFVTGSTVIQNGLTANTLTVQGLTQTSGITSTGGIIFPQKTINSTYTAQTEDYTIDASGGTFTIYLPTAVGIQGKLYNIKNNGGGAVTVQPFGSETIDDKPFVILGETNALQLVSNGSGWVALGYNISTVNSSTGVFEFSGITTASTTTFYVSPVKGWIVDDTTNPLSPQIYYLSYSGGVSTDNFVNTSTETFVFLNNGGTISQQSTPLSEQQRRQNIFLGKLSHPNKTSIYSVFSQPDFVLSPLGQLRDMFTPINLINGGILPSTNGTNLKFNTSAGYLYGLGINFANNTLSPNTIYVTGENPRTFQYRTQTGVTLTDVTDIDPLNYDVGGVVTPITGTKATNQRIYLQQDGSVVVMYGQQNYNTLALAISALQNESFISFPNLSTDAILIGVLSVLSTATDLTDTTKAKFFFASKFGETIGAAGGSSTTNLQQAYNNSTSPEITTNSILGGVQFKGGTGNDNDKNIIIENNSGVETAWITASGDSSFNSLSATSVYTNYIDFNTTYVPTQQEGRLHWDVDYGTLDVDLEGNNINLKVGLDNLYYIKNQSGATIDKGRVVRAAGALGASGRILGEYMIADGTIPYYFTLGIAGENILNGEDGYVYEFGLVRGINTTGSLYGETWVDGTILYVSPTISGGLTSVEPIEPNLKIQIAIVIKSAVNGSLFVRPSLGSNLGDLHNVQTSGQTNGDLISYNSSQGYWEYTKTLNGNYIISGNTNNIGSLSATTFYGSGLGLNNIPISGVTNLQNSLDLKTNLSDFVLHTGNTNNPHQTSFSQLTSTAHTHTISDVIDLQTNLNLKFDKSGGTVTGDVLVLGNVTILGTATTINTQTLSIADNVVTLNSNITGGTPFVGHSGIEVLRGSGTTAALLWEEQRLQWEAGLHGSTKKIILQGDSLALLSSGHTHPISEVNGLQTALDDKLSKSTGGTVLGFTSFNNGLSAYTSNDEFLIIPFKSVGFYDDGGTPLVGQTTIGGYFESSGGTNSYSLQLKDGTQGLNKVLVSKTNDGKANWSDSLNVNSVSATTYYGNFAYVSNIIATNSFSSSTYSTNVGNTQVVFSNNGSLSGTTNLTWSNSTLNINGGLNVTGNTILQSVTASTGVISGNLNVNGNTVLKSITGNGETTLNGNLTVTGNTLVNGSVLALNNISANTKLFIITTPTSGITSTQILMRNSTTGEVEITDNTSPNIFNYGLANAMINLNFLT